MSASLQEHVAWYKAQVDRLAELLRVLDGIPPRMKRSLRDYHLYEDTMDAVQAILAAVDDWTIRLAAVRTFDYGLVLHNNLEQLLLSACGGRGRHSRQASQQLLVGSPPGAPASSSTSGSSSGEGAPGEAAAAAAVWQGILAELELTPQQEQTLEAHQALWEQWEAGLDGYKAAMLQSFASVAARQDGQAEELELLEGAEVLKESLQRDMLAKAPVMLSLRKVLTPLQMARLTVRCWPFFSTMKNVTRAHKQRKEASGPRPM